MCRKKKPSWLFECLILFFILCYLFYLSLCLFIWEGQQHFFYLKTCKKVLVGKRKNKHVFLKKKKIPIFLPNKKEKIALQEIKNTKKYYFFPEDVFF